MKKAIKVFSVLVCLLLLTGCIKFENTMVISKDKSVKLDIIYAMNIDAVKDMLGSEYTEDTEDTETSSEYGVNKSDYSVYEEAGFTVVEYSDEDGYEGVKISKTFDSIDDISDSSTDEVNIYDLFAYSENITVEELNSFKFFNKTDNIYKANFVFDFTSEDDSTDYEDLGIDTTELEKLFKYSYKVTLPNESISNNATTVSKDCKTLEWDLKNNELTNVKYEFEFQNDYTLYIIIGVLLLISIIVVIIFKKKSKA